MGLIDADALMVSKKWENCTCPAQVIRGAPTIEAEPVRHGRWIERKSFHAEGGVSARCSVCRKDIQYLGQPLCYCPNCGAKMDLENNYG